MPKRTNPIPCVVSIHIARAKAEPLVRVRRATLVVDRGIEGDRYWNESGTFSKKRTPDRQVTLIEEEALLAAAADYDVKAKPGDARRNIVTRGVALNHLVGRIFQVGDVVLEGIMLCEPCGHLAKLSSPQLRAALVHRGGLRARILQGGIIQPGDSVRTLSSSRQTRAAHPTGARKTGASTARGGGSRSADPR